MLRTAELGCRRFAESARKRGAMWCEGCKAYRRPSASLQCDMCGKTGCTQCVTDTGLYRVCDECLEQ